MIRLWHTFTLISLFKKGIEGYLYVNQMAQIKLHLSYLISDIFEYDLSSSFICDQKLCMLRVLARKFLGSF